MKRLLFTPDAPKPAGPYSQAVELGNLVFVSGQLGIDPMTGKLVPDGAKEETSRCLSNLEAILRAGGMTRSDVLRTTLFVTDLERFREVNEVYGAFFDRDPPARTTVQVSRLPLGASVEIDAIAIRDG